MKRIDILKKLAEAGFTFEEGGRHTKAIGPNGEVTFVGRHTEIPNPTARQIEDQSGVKLFNSPNKNGEKNDILSRRVLPL